MGSLFQFRIPCLELVAKDALNTQFADNLLEVRPHFGRRRYTRSLRSGGLQNTEWQRSGQCDIP